MNLKSKILEKQKKSASFLNLHPKIGSKDFYDKRYDVDFSIVNFPFMSSNISVAHAYEVYVSQLIRYSRACSSYQNFIDIGLQMIRKLMSLGFLRDR